MARQRQAASHRRLVRVHHHGGVGGAVSGAFFGDGGAERRGCGAERMMVQVPRLRTVTTTTPKTGQTQDGEGAKKGDPARVRVAVLVVLAVLAASSVVLVVLGE